jgi:hypothetical protein
MLIRDDDGYYRGDENGKALCLPSVTTVINSIFNPYEGIDEFRLKKAGAYGHNVHLATALDDAGNLDYKYLDKGLGHPLESWRAYKTSSQINIIKIEETVWSKRGFAGTLDRIGEINGRMAIIDIKTRPVHLRTDSLQLAAYAAAYKELSGQKCSEAYVVQLFVDEIKYCITKIKELDEAYHVFLCLLAAFNWNKKYIFFERKI